MLHLKSVNLKKQKIETLAIPVCEDKDIHQDPAIQAVIKKALKLNEFSGKKDEAVTFYDLPEIKTRRVMLAGLGNFKNLDRETLRTMAGKSVKSCINNELANLWFAVPAAEKLDLKPSEVIEAMQEGAYLANHIFQKYKGEKKNKTLKQLNFLVNRQVAGKFRHLCSKVAAVCEGTYLAREWVNTPSNEKTPEKFTRSIVNLAKKQGLRVQVINEAQLKQKKFGALLAVAAGSQSKPSLVVLEHKVPGAKKTVALVGKGVTFDSGGLNIKTGGSMADMKCDMSGAAAVAATLITAARLKKKVNIIGAIPIVENMPSGQAIRPGDIIRSYAGKTIEIGNTDAEGRLILIDAMSYVIKRYKPQMLVDLATLTGACVVALGEKIAGVFSNDDDLAASITAAGEKTHERCWRLPLPDDYKELLKSDFADINNMPSSRNGGAVTAALFLADFVDDTRWAHIDIAGPAYHKKESDYCGPGATGFGVRLLTELLGKI
ncbi:Cytosol aminopeptidase PepA (EC [Olavius sp. associated proteobacterium Delta 1]|nr:Cytosol aminopeptidase PepA (EC [Olavius sp. associated proteobacterium Delta 1]